MVSVFFGFMSLIQAQCENKTIFHLFLHVDYTRRFVGLAWRYEIIEVLLEMAICILHLQDIILLNCIQYAHRLCLKIGVSS